jgi:hypothetical protein
MGFWKVLGIREILVGELGDWGGDGGRCRIAGIISTAIGESCSCYGDGQELVLRKSP